ncbi:hypothetical protein BST25_22685 [Mycobacterium heidelbergense]|uniref:Uncharacterized protein n=1 Tax=Mycobacterium heidelbergense TaxID=53376 RepID=A0A1X0D4T9_MYCHE|nr:hypothetical protein BST25_22685 [Mycobacterium heidelbergense]
MLLYLVIRGPDAMELMLPASQPDVARRLRDRASRTRSGLLAGSIVGPMDRKIVSGAARLRTVARPAWESNRGAGR